MFSQSCDLNFSTIWSKVSSQNLRSFGVHDGWQTVRRRPGERCQLTDMIAHDRDGGGSVVVWGEITMVERAELHIRRMSLGSTTETILLSLLLFPTPVGMGMHSSFKTTMHEPIVHVLSKITCSLAKSRLCHRQRSPQTYFQLNICGTSLEDVSGDGLSTQRTSTSWLMHSRRNGICGTSS